MKKILVTDIFGITPAINSLCKLINVSTVVDPYDAKEMDFNNEAEAYHFFIKHIGLDAYVEKLSTIVKECDSQVYLIGFSIGASAIWKLSDIRFDHLHTVKGAVCYYGSQIRHHTTVLPVFKVQIVFPKRESHFDVNALKSKLTKKCKNNENVLITQVDYLHGFMNKHSNHFDQVGFDNHVKQLKYLDSNNDIS